MRERAVAEDFVEYGQSPEFMGRAGVLVNMGGLAQSDLYDIVADPESGLARRYDDMLGGRGTFALSPGAASVLAMEAAKSPMGVRRAQSLLAPFGAQAVVESRGWAEKTEALVSWDAETGELCLGYVPYAGSGRGTGRSHAGKE